MPARSSAFRFYALATVFSVALLSACSARGPLHVASPDWRDQVIYFAMIDRFADGDPRNNDQGAGEFDPGDGRRYSGGDLRGLTRQLDYIQDLGATALWVTPPVAHRWWDAQTSYGGYHGYWATDFSRIDPHFGDLGDYQTLSRALHARGMFLIQDIVVNHTANYFSYDDSWNSSQPELGFRLNPDAAGATAPTQWPFSLNDVRDPEQRAADIYHWTPTIRDFRDPDQELRFQLAELDDLNTENQDVRRVLRQSYGHWIQAAGVDGFRVDTAFYVPPEFFDDFLHAEDPVAPGVLMAAAKTGREDFHVFGEGFGIDAAFADRQTRRIEPYQTRSDGAPRLGGMINFPLYGSLLDVFARGEPSTVLADRIERMMHLHRVPHRMPSFVDNHDVDRFLATGSRAGLHQALLAILTLPGIPTIYYGTEQDFSETRAAMFRNGYAARGRDHFDRDSETFGFLKQAIALRRTHPALSRGVPELLVSEASGPGVVAWRMSDASEALLIVFNTADHDVLVDHLDTGNAAGTLSRLLGIGVVPSQMKTDAQGRLPALVLAARAAGVWAWTSGDRAPSKQSPVSISDFQIREDQSAIEIRGRAAGLARVQLVVDGNLARAESVDVDPEGNWQAALRTDDMVDPEIRHHVVAWAPDRTSVSASKTFQIARRWQSPVRFGDAVGDDHGPGGTYTYPDDPGWRLHRPGDLIHADVRTSGGALKLDLTMNELSSLWNPALGFDHVAFTVYFALPGRDDGVRILPLQRAQMPANLHWHYRLRTHGWSNAWFSAEGADAENEGQPHAPGARVRVDADARAVQLTIPAAALGYPDNLSGLRIYITTWDYDGGYKPLAPQAGPNNFGGGDASRDPLILDDLLIELP